MIATTGPAPLYPEILARAVDLPLPPSEGSPSPSQPASTSKGSRLLGSFDKDKKIARLLKFTSKYYYCCSLIGTAQQTFACEEGNK